MYRIEQLRSLEADVSAEIEKLQPDRVSNSADLPASGDATYVGIMSLSVPTLDSASPSDLIYGFLDVSADFAGSQTTLSGSANGFRNLDDAVYSGELDITGRTAPSGIASGFLVLGDVEGDLLTPNDSPLSLDIELLADVYGAGGDAILGTLSGTGQVEAEDGSHGRASSVFGTFLAAADEPI